MKQSLLLVAVAALALSACGPNVRESRVCYDTKTHTRAPASACESATSASNSSGNEFLWYYLIFNSMNNAQRYNVPSVGQNMSVNNFSSRPSSNLAVTEPDEEQGEVAAPSPTEPESQESTTSETQSEPSSSSESESESSSSSSSSSSESGADPE